MDCVYPLLWITMFNLTLDGQFNFVLAQRDKNQWQVLDLFSSSLRAGHNFCMYTQLGRPALSCSFRTILAPFLYFSCAAAGPMLPATVCFSGDDHNENAIFQGHHHHHHRHMPIIILIIKAIFKYKVHFIVTYETTFKFPPPLS